MEEIKGGFKPKAKHQPFPTMGEAEYARKKKRGGGVNNVGTADKIGSPVLYTLDNSTAKWADIKFRKLPTNLFVSSYGVVENEEGHQPYISIYRTEDPDMCLKYFRFFFTSGATTDKRRPTHKVPYMLEQEGTYYLIIDTKELKSYVDKLRNIISLAITYSKNSSVMYNMFEYYGGTVLTWHRHIEVKKILNETLTVDKLRQAMLYYSKPERLKIVRA